jgi:signal transduction histidine kinase
MFLSQKKNNLNMNLPNNSIKDFEEQNKNDIIALDEASILNILTDLKEDKKSLEDQRIATLNILEDISEAQEELQFKYKHTRVLQNLLQRLTITIDPKSVMENMLSAFEELLDFDVVSFVISDFGGAKNYSHIYLYSKTLIGRSYIEVSRASFLEFLDSLPASVKNVVNLKQQLRGKLYHEFIKGSMQTDEALGRRPASGFVVPLLFNNIDEKILLGAFYIASLSEKTKYSQTQIEVARDIAILVSMNIERIKTMIRSEYSRMSNIVDSMSNGVIVYNQALAVTLANPIIEKMTGLPCSSSSSSSSSSMFPLEEFGNLIKDINILEIAKSVLNSGISTHIKEAKLFNYYFEIYISPVRDSNGDIQGGAIIMHDITHTKEVSKIESDFITTASHQLRTPLTGIQWVIERFLKKEKVTEQGKEFLNDIHTSVSRLTSLVDLLLNVSRIEGGRVGISPQPLELVGFMNGYIEEIEPLIVKNNLKLNFQRHPKELNIITDSSAMRNIVQSLVSNAIEYTPEGGEIGISLEKLEHASSAKSDASNSNKKALGGGKADKSHGTFLLTIGDTGIGIPKEEQKTIFDKFTRAKNAQLVKTDGTGLGMYIAKQAVELLGGKIWFHSTVGKGTVFYVELPIEAKEKKGERQIA